MAAPSTPGNWRYSTSSTPPRVREHRASPWYSQRADDVQHLKQKTVPYPTVLIAASGSRRQYLADHLLEEKCLILKANDAAQMLEVVRLHSRPIHVLLVDADIAPVMAEVLQRYRPGMRVVSVTWSADSSRLDAVLPDAALGKALDILKDAAAKVASTSA